MNALVLVMTLAAGLDVESDRIRSHLELVEQLLRSQPSASLERRRNLDVLHAYWQRGEFPQNVTRPGARTPVFIDHRGVPCAVGALIIESGSPALALRIAQTMNEAYLEQMHDDALGAWVASSGLTLGELRLIQPSYAFRRPAEQFLLVAGTGDLAKVKALLSKGDKDQGLRAALMSGRSTIAVVDYLLANGANPNDLGTDSRSLLFRATNAEMRARLIAAGAKLLPVEEVEQALKDSRCDEVPGLLAALKVDLRWQLGLPDLLHVSTQRECVLAVIRSPTVPVISPSSGSTLRGFAGEPEYLAELLKRGAPITEFADLAPVIDAWRRVHRSSATDAQAQAKVLLAAITATQIITVPRADARCDPLVQAAIRSGDAEAVELFAKAGATVKGCDNR